MSRSLKERIFNIDLNGVQLQFTFSGTQLAIT